MPRLFAPHYIEIQVVLSGPTGREQIHFEAPHAKLLESEMACFFTWLNLETDIDPVLKSFIAQVWFLTIHPFDGLIYLAFGLAVVHSHNNIGLSIEPAVSAHISAKRSKQPL